jgi:hypothetical protein
MSHSIPQHSYFISLSQFPCFGTLICNWTGQFLCYFMCGLFWICPLHCKQGYHIPRTHIGPGTGQILCIFDELFTKQFEVFWGKRIQVDLTRLDLGDHANPDFFFRAVRLSELTYLWDHFFKVYCNPFVPGFTLVSGETYESLPMLFSEQACWMNEFCIQ